MAHKLLAGLLLLPYVSSQIGQFFDPFGMSGGMTGGMPGMMSLWGAGIPNHGQGAPMAAAPTPPSVAGVEEQMAEVLSETPRNNPERQRLDRLIQTSGGRLRGRAEPLNYLINEYLMTSPAPTPPPTPRPNQNQWANGGTGGRRGRGGNGGQQREVEQQQGEGQRNTQNGNWQTRRQQQPKRQQPNISPWKNQARHQQPENMLGWQGPPQQGRQNKRQQRRQKPRQPVTPQSPPATTQPPTKPTPPPEPKAKLTKLRPSGQRTSILGERLRLIQKRIDLMTEVQKGIKDSNQIYQMQQKINSLNQFRDTLQGKTAKRLTV